MCDCHPLTPEQQKAWKRVKAQPTTREDWEYLHSMIEGYRRRLIDRELLADSLSSPVQAAERKATE